jgi:N utilization substance protein A
MNGEFLEALQQIAREKELTQEALSEMVERALISAYRKNYNALPGEVKVRRETGKVAFRVIVERPIVADGEVDQPEQISISDAILINPDAQIGGILEKDVTDQIQGRIAAQTAKQVVVQQLREAEREKVVEEYSQRVGEVLTGVVERRDQRNVIVNVGKIDGILPPNEQTPGEPYRVHDRIKVYVLEAKQTQRGPQVLLTRTHPGMIRRLFELEVPEIAEGIVSIMSVAREPGARSKIAVSSRDEKVDPVGSCVGHRGSRVQAVVNELYDEKIDIIRWSADISQFIGESLSPAKVSYVRLDESNKAALVVVADNQLSLAIGKSGQNVRLAARLTGWRIDIRSESQVAKPAAGAPETAPTPKPSPKPKLAEEAPAEPVAEVEVAVAEVAPVVALDVVATEPEVAAVVEVTPVEAAEVAPAAEAGADPTD